MMQIPIFFTFDRNYVVPAAVAFHSLLRRADPQYTYRLYVLYTDIPETDRQRLTRLVERTGHGTLEFIDVSAFDRHCTVLLPLSRRILLLCRSGTGAGERPHDAVWH